MAKTEIIPAAEANAAAQLDFGRLRAQAHQVEGSQALDKDSLIGAELVVTDWHENPGDFGPNSSYFVLSVVTQDGRQGVFTDGGVGIRGQIEKHVAAHGAAPIYCPNGLRCSRYSNQYTADGKTYYLA